MAINWRSLWELWWLNFRPQDDYVSRSPFEQVSDIIIDENIGNNLFDTKFWMGENGTAGPVKRDRSN